MARRHLIAIIPDRGQEYVGWGTKFFKHIAIRVPDGKGGTRWRVLRSGFEVKDLYNPREIGVYVFRHNPPKPRKIHQ